MKVTQKHFKKFQQYCKSELRKHRLEDWIVSYQYGGTSDGQLSCVEYDSTQRVACIKIAQEWEGVNITEDNLKETALHEVLHIVLAQLIDISESRFCSNEMVGNEEHSVINRLVHARYGVKP